MKLYTEEQVRDLLRGVWTYTPTQIDNLMDVMPPIELPSDMLCVNCDESKPTHNICMECIIKVGKQNIELPSDEEIEEASPKTNTLYERIGEIGWIEGAKWMRDKIQGGNK